MGIILLVPLFPLMFHKDVFPAISSLFLGCVVAKKTHSNLLLVLPLAQ